MNAYIDQAAQQWLLAVKAAQMGFKKLEEDYSPESLNAAAATILIHAQKLTLGNGHSNGNGTGHTPMQETGVTDACKYCGGEVWDNRRSKKNPKGPDFKCKDQTCGGAAWINKDGSLAWKQ